MSWEDRDEFVGGKDMMGVTGDVLFADPLNVRGGGGGAASQRGGPPPGARGYPPSRPAEQRPNYQRPPPPPVNGGGASSYPGASSPSRGAAGRGDNDDEEPRREGEEEDWGPVGNFVWWVVAGGRQCCSMRDRTKPGDAEAKKRIAESGRPPESRFPEPGPEPVQPPRGVDSFRPRDEAPTEAASSYRGPDLSASVFSTHQDLGGGGGDGGGGFPNFRGGGGGNYGAEARSKGAYGREDSEESIRSSDRRRGGGHGGAAASQPPPPRQEAPFPMPSSAPSAMGPPSPRPLPAAAPATSQAPLGGGGGGGAAGSAAAPGAALAKRWEWPTWCLNFKQPCIEVWVVDDDTGVGRWVEAEPQSRVVDKSGRDAYLCVEYDWDGEYYVQDFGPQHVRRRGQKETVFQVFDRQQADGGGYEDLDRTRLAPGRSRANDTGGGVSAFLEDSR